MNAIRNLLVLVMAVALAAFALPSMGQQNNDNKHFSFTTNLGAPNNNQQGSVVFATITNDNPSGSSAQIGSFLLSFESASGITIADAVANGPNLGATVSHTTTSVTVTGINPLKAMQSYTVKVLVNGCGDGNSWTVSAWSGPTLNGTQYNDSDSTGIHVTDVACGALACNDALGGDTVKQLINTVIADKSGKSLSRRGPFNQDGVCGSTVNYYVTELAEISSLHIRWDTEPSAVFFYVLKVVDPTVAPRFAWKTDGGGAPIFVAAQACDQGKKAQFPMPYGTVVADNVTSLTVNTSAPAGQTVSPPPTPFRIAAGPKPQQFMTVTKTQGSTWTVNGRPTGPLLAVGATVMGTPAPALPTTLACFDGAGNSATCPYVSNGPALMCYVPSNDSANLYVFDIGDGYVKGGI
jgi:hypothetical protein